MVSYGRTIAAIDLDALEFNMKNIRQRVPEGVRILGTLKADAYGHGAKEVYQVLRENGADIFSVATVEEGERLRRMGVTEDILLLGYAAPCDMELGIRLGLIFALPSQLEGEQLSAAAQKAGRPARAHVKIDTGMGRIGFFPTQQSARQIAALAQDPHLQLEGIFTHFAKSDAADKTYTRFQQEKFDLMIDLLEKEGVTLPLHHCANSAALMDFPDLYYDLVRPGIILYGHYPSDEVHQENLALRPVMQWLSQVAFLKEVPAETAISYGCTYVTKQPRWIATIPVGYADGYSRSLSNRGYVLIHGQKAPVVGRICMDQMMVDVTEIDDVAYEDQVILVGRDGEEELPVEVLSDLSGRFNYEFVCDIGKRVPREFYRHGEITEQMDWF